MTLRKLPSFPHLCPLPPAGPSLEGHACALAFLQQRSRELTASPTTDELPRPTPSAGWPPRSPLSRVLQGIFLLPLLPPRSTPGLAFDKATRLPHVKCDKWHFRALNFFLPIYPSGIFDTISHGFVSWFCFLLLSSSLSIAPTSDLRSVALNPPGIRSHF